MLWRFLRPALVFLLCGLAACTNAPPASSPEPPQTPAPAAEASPPLSIIQRGKASYYADDFHGRLTATGEAFDQNALTAASKVIPLGARAEITNLRTGKSVMVEVNDRGPHVRGRVIDLSRRAANEIGIYDGLAPVKVEARAADQPTPALRDKVAKVAAKRAKRQQIEEAHATDGPSS
jgi:rare lipoprotein A